MASTYYFAYGSNLWVARMVRRVPSARPRTVATLAGHRLGFDKRGVDGSAKANIQPADGAAVVHGVVFEIAASDRVALDQVEGAPREYHVHDVLVEGREGSVEAFTYKATPETLAEGLRPFDWYRDFVLEGARSHGFPEEYVREIEAVAVVFDEDTVRRERERDLLERKGSPIR